MVSDTYRASRLFPPQAPYPLSQEIIDFGYPQNSEADTLKTYITTESIVSTNIAAVCPC